MSQDLDITEAKNLIAHYTAEIEDLEFELGQSNKIIKEQQAEIEQLKEKYQNAHREGYEHGKLENQYEVAELAIENAELQKQVDELAYRLAEKSIATEGINVTSTDISLYLHEKLLEQAVKDKAKEILQELWNETEATENDEWVRAKIKEIAKSKGVEVK